MYECVHEYVRAYVYMCVRVFAIKIGQGNRKECPPLNRRLVRNHTISFKMSTPAVLLAIQRLSVQLILVWIEFFFFLPGVEEFSNLRA